MTKRSIIIIELQKVKNEKAGKGR
uniref:Uncharacterized protein n=1 Tax=Rhizophora mucronata TaxID=61149 RepID=A0A2P2PEZ1_RHIMU